MKHHNRIEEIAKLEKFKGTVGGESFWPATGIKLDFKIRQGLFEGFLMEGGVELSSGYQALLKGGLCLLEGQNWTRLSQMSFREIESFLRDVNTEAVLQEKLYQDFWEDFIWRIKVLSWQKIEGILVWEDQWSEDYEGRVKILKGFFDHHINPKIGFLQERVELVSLEENQVCIAFEGKSPFENWKFPAMKEVFNQFFSDKGLYLVVESSQIS